MKTKDKKKRLFPYVTSYEIEELICWKLNRKSLSEALAEKIWSFLQDDLSGTNGRELYWRLEQLAGDRFQVGIDVNGDYLDISIIDISPGAELDGYGYLPGYQKDERQKVYIRELNDSRIGVFDSETSKLLKVAEPTFERAAFFVAAGMIEKKGWVWLVAPFGVAK